MKFNERKLKVLWAAKMLEDERKIINSVRIARLTELSVANVGGCLLQMVSYFKPTLDPKRTNGCTIKYTTLPQGKRVLEQLLERYGSNEHLNLRKSPGPADYSTFDLLPGLTRAKREQAGIRGECYEGATNESQ